MPQQSPRTVKRLGWVLLAIGVFLVGMMGTIAWKMYPSMSHPGIADASGTTFTGTPEQARQALQIFALVFAFGVLSMLNGLWQVATGRRNMIFVVVTLALAGTVYFAARTFMQT